MSVLKRMLVRHWDGCLKMPVLLLIRPLSSGEVSTALRPFYFGVHPDLFEQYPKERAVNENSLKQLNSYIENLLQNKPALPAQVTFYVRSRKETNALEKGVFQVVRISLRQRDVRKTVEGILQTCKLSTSFIDTIPVRQKPKPAVTPERIIPREREWKDRTKYGEFQEEREVRQAKQMETLLEPWLKQNIKDAQQKLKVCEPIREEILRLCEEIKASLGLENIVWDCGWGTTHFRGCLLSFGALAAQHGEDMKVLKGLTLVFGRETGVSLDGQVSLNTGEVRNNWLDLIKNVRKHDGVLLRIPAVEKAVSRTLKDIKVVHRKFQPKVLASQYESQLKKLITTLGDYKGTNGYPRHWPEKLDRLQLVVETAAGPLMLSPTGQFIVPASCPAFLLVNFISENMEKAVELLSQYQRDKITEVDLHSQCMRELNLQSLNKDDNVTPNLMIACCERLLQRKDVFRDILNGARVYVTHYYSVLSDGEMCIPWNWKS